MTWAVVIQDGWCQSKSNLKQLEGILLLLFKAATFTLFFKLVSGCEAFFGSNYCLLYVFHLEEEVILMVPRTVWKWTDYSTPQYGACATYWLCWRTSPIRLIHNNNLMPTPLYGISANNVPTFLWLYYTLQHWEQEMCCYMLDEYMPTCGNLLNRLIDIVLRRRWVSALTHAVLSHSLNEMQLRNYKMSRLN